MNEIEKQQLQEIRDILNESLNYCYLQIVRPKVKKSIEKIDELLK